MEHTRFFLTADYLPGPPDLPIDQEKWDEGLKAGIVSNPEMYENVQLPKQGLVTRPWVYRDRSGNFIIHNDNSPRRDREEVMVTQSMKLFRLDLVNLLKYIAEKWGLRPDVEPTVGRLYKIGWRTGNTVVVIYEHHEYDGEFGDEALLWVKGELRAEFLYVINIGETQWPLSEIKQLAKKGVIDIGSEDFLTPDCQPRWDLFQTQESILQPMRHDIATDTEKGKRQEKDIKGLIPFQTPLGTTWAQVKIEFVKDDVVKITAGTECEHVTYAEMGFADHRKIGKPPVIGWELLKQLAKLEGRLGWEDHQGTSFSDPARVKKWISDLRKKLIAYFGIDDDPFKQYQKVRAYETKFTARYDVGNNESR